MKFIVIFVKWKIWQKTNQYFKNIEYCFIIVKCEKLHYILLSGIDIDYILGAELIEQSRG